MLINTNSEANSSSGGLRSGLNSHYKEQNNTKPLSAHELPSDGGNEKESKLSMLWM